MRRIWQAALSGFVLASRTIELVYAAYRSAWEGRRITLDL